MIQNIKSKKTNIFFTRTPFQLFNAIEAKNRFHSKDYNILVYLYDKNNKIDKIQFENLITKTDWNQIINYALTSISRIFFYKLYHYFDKKYIDTIYTGSYMPLINFYINRLKPNNITNIDDGQNTFLVIKNIEKSSHYKHKGITKFIEKLFYIDYEYVNTINFFTIYNIADFNINNKFILNDYRDFKNKVMDLPVDNNLICFIGSNIRNRILKDSNNYEKYIEWVMSKYQDNTVIYVLHRYEDYDYMINLAKKYHFKLQRFNTILEAAFLYELHKKPSKLISLSSTATKTLNMLYNISVEIYQINQNDIKTKYQDMYKEVYNDYRANNIPVYINKSIES